MLVVTKIYATGSQETKFTIWEYESIYLRLPTPFIAQILKISFRTK